MNHYWPELSGHIFKNSQRVKFQVIYRLLQIKGVALTIGVLECLCGKLIIVNEVATINANTYHSFIKYLSWLQNDRLIFYKPKLI